MSEYRLQIINLRTGHVVHGWQPGDRIEVDLVSALSDRIKAKGVGVFRTEARVLDAVRSAFAEMLHDLKVRV